jgi:hypothetical protein
MSGLLVFSPKCPKCNDLLIYISQKPQLAKIIHLHNVNTQGIPQQYANYIRSVPTLLVPSGNKIISGANEIRNFLDSLFPSELMGAGESSSLFDLNNYGVSLQPQLTPDIIAKINAKVQ